MTRFLSAALALTLVTSASDTLQNATSGLPPRLEQYLKSRMKLSEDQRRDLVAGGPVTKLVNVDESSELGIFGAIWIDAPIRRYVEAVTDIEQFERGGAFLVTRRISAPPRLEDFAELRLREKDVADLRTCKVGDCAVKLDANTIQALRAEVDWKTPEAAATVNRALQRFALFYVNGYLEAGNARLAVYRDKSRPTAVAEEFGAMVQHVPELTPSVGEMRRYLLEYPNVAPGDATSFLYWQETDFGLKPTIRISHMAVREGQDDTVVASKMLYASHYFWTGLEVRVLLPDPSRGPGFWLVNFNFGRSDGLGGFTGRIVRVWVRSAAQKKMLAALRATKRRVEGPREAADAPTPRLFAHQPTAWPSLRWSDPAR